MKDVPADYYARLAEIDSRHWWTQGMLGIEASLLAPWIERGAVDLLDAGCGTGGFLAWSRRRNAFTSLSGVDLSREAIEIARRRLPDANLSVAPLSALPHAADAFDVIVLNDVLQHVDESDIQASLAELRRVLRSSGVLALRTNGSRRPRRERSDWRLYSTDSLRADLGRGGFVVTRLTHANAVFSALAELRGRSPRPPTAATCGIPDVPGQIASALGSLTLSAEAWLVGHGRTIPWGHTILALAVPR